MSGDAASAGTQDATKPVRLLRATKGEDGYRLTLEGQEEVIGEVRGADFWKRDYSRSTTATAGARAWEVDGLVASERGSQVARVRWTDGRAGRFRSFRRLDPVAFLERPHQPTMRLFVSPWQNLTTRAQKRAAYALGHWSLETPDGVGVMNFAFSNRVAAKIYVAVFPAGERDPDQLLVALLCVSQIWLWDEHGHGPDMT